MNFEEMSIRELSILVCEARGIEVNEERTKMYIDISKGFECDDESIFVNVDGNVEYFNINNPSDMMPIVFENKIAIIEPDVDDGELWSAGQVYGVCEWHKDKNPLRAAAICFLKMMEAR